MDTKEGLAGMVAHLETHGYAVVAGCLSPDEVEHAKGLAWEWLENPPGGSAVRRNAIKTWDTHWLPDPDNGIMHGFGFCHSDFCWFIRTRQAVRRAFEAVWATQSLIVSFDGGNFFRPYAHPLGKRDWKTSGGWWHVDQNHFRPGHEGKVCVQGVVLLTPANTSTG